MIKKLHISEPTLLLGTAQATSKRHVLGRQLGTGVRGRPMQEDKGAACS